MTHYAFIVQGKGQLIMKYNIIILFIINKYILSLQLFSSPTWKTLLDRLSLTSHNMENKIMKTILGVQ